MNKGGRKTKLTTEVQSRFIAFLRAGNYVETAAASAGIHRDSYYEWMRRGRTGECPFAEFAEAVDQAIADSEIHDVGLIGKAAADNWQAAAWRLERKHPARWGRKDRHEITGPEGDAIKVGIVVLPAEVTH